MLHQPYTLLIHHHREARASFLRRRDPHLQRAGQGRAVDHGRQTGPELDAAVRLQVRGQSGEIIVVHSSLQVGELHDETGVAGSGEVLVANQYLNQDDHDGWTSGTPFQEAGVSVPMPSRILDGIGTCRGGGVPGGNPAIVGACCRALFSTRVANILEINRGE